MISKELVNRYATVLYRLSTSKEQLKNDLISVTDIIAKSPDLLRFLQAPQIKRQDKENVLRKLFENKIEPAFLNFLFFLLEKRRIPDLATITREYVHIFTEESAMIETKMITAIPIDKSTRDKIQKVMEKGFQQKVEIEEKVDPNILGGIILIIGHQMMDASVKSQLAELKDNLLDITV